MHIPHHIKQYFVWLLVGVQGLLDVLNPFLTLVISVLTIRHIIIKTNKLKNK